jgi:hypothetical protein
VPAVAADNRVVVTEPGVTNLNDNLGSPAAGDTTLGVERLLELGNGGNILLQLRLEMGAANWCGAAGIAHAVRADMFPSAVVA